MVRGLMRRWRGSRRRQLHAFPLGPEGELPWHSTPKQVRTILASHKAASNQVDGQQTARLRFADRTLRASLEFTDGICLGPTTFLSAVPGCRYARRDGTRVGLGPQLRAANVFFEKEDPRGNWKWVLDWLGKPDEKLGNGWEWRWETMSARWFEPDHLEQSPEWVRFTPGADARALEIVNQSSLELYSRVQLRLDFKQGTWHMTDPPALAGVPTRLHWDTPTNEVLLLTATAEGVERSAEVPRRVHRVLLTNHAEGGVRIVV